MEVSFVKKHAIHLFSFFQMYIIQEKGWFAMRKTARNHGFLLCLVLNMMFRFEWAIAAIVLLVIHFWLGWPLFLVWIALGIWLLYALFVTLVLSAANRIGNEPPAERPNKNPYSKSNADFPQNP